MEKLLIIGASGFGRETAWLVERINQYAETPQWLLLGFIDDNVKMHGEMVNAYPVLGGREVLEQYHDAYVVCAIGSAKIRRKVVEGLRQQYPSVRFATLIDPSVIRSNLIEIGEGTIICAHTILTVNIQIGCHVIINLDCTVGHDAIVHDYVTMYPSVNVSGATEIGENTELGTGMQIIQGVKIGTHAVIGAGAVVIRDIPDKCTAVGSPAKPIKFFE